MMTNKDNDKLKNENPENTLNEGNKVPNIKSVDEQQVTENKAQAGEIGGIKPQKGGRQGGTSVEDGGQDIGSSAGSR
ncbi:hypothetical protein FVR03_21395 [Pontibacter qinzhouensis]|uniref:Uncharacterized protein n=1 Tax=Pontibacter qinzhouensis TaxID=2603253 RepID=A0A5C8J0S9_9BACT|nr:hypothetical protein [Pontibacter qinzhouensis]TXK26985.1 hypothetical protein FVR03_21395 [Pontibacter qinzhouensis]